jgi:predicted outer membrane protein
MRNLQKLQACLALGSLILLSGAVACESPTSGGPTSTGAPPGSAAPQSAQAHAANDVPPGAAQEQAGAPAVPDVSTLDDYSLAAVIQSTHQRIAQQAQLAERSTQSADVKQLSHDMFALHSDVLSKEQALFQQLNLVPHASVVSQQIDADASRTLQTLRSDHGNAFDHDYLDAQLQTFRDAIQLFDRMYPVAKAQDLKGEIAHNRPDLVAGMQYVSRLQEQMNLGVTNRQGK